MSKEQTPIEQILKTTLVIDNPKGIKYAVEKLETHLNTKVLEALEREFGKLIDLKPNRKYTAIMDAKSYYEKEVKPKYKK